MSQAIVTESKLVAIGDAIRQQLGTSVSYTLDEMASAIASISGGGGGGGGDLDAFIAGELSEVNTGASKINSYAFYSNQVLTSIVGNNVLSIGSNAFCSCFSLTSYSFPRVTSVGVAAFQGCGINDFNFPSLTSAGNYAFSNCSKLLNVSTNLTAIGYAMFMGCYSLASVSIPNATILNYGAFQGCSKIVSFYAPNVVNVVSYALNTAFTSSTIVDLPNLESVGSSAFMNALMKEISAPKLNNVYSYAFAYCNYLTKVDFTTTKITYVRSSCFYNCSNLSIVSVNTGQFGNDAFYNCKKLSILDLNACSSVPTFVVRTLSNTPMSNSTYLGYFGSIYVPASLYASYIASTNWAVFSARITSDPVPTT